ncbi:MAG: AsmA-like C-terminal region-containing protein [Cytophagales bacterium]|nr:AsmA-like C-terminal region-containing protein [Cytophagales bacterium]
MKKILKYIAIFFALLLLLLGTALYLLYENRNKIVQIFINEANKSLNAKVLADSITLEFIDTYPDFAITFHDFVIYESIPLSQKIFARGRKAYFYFSIKDFLMQRYTIKKFHVVDADFNFIINKNGQENYNIFKISNTTSQESKIYFNLKDCKITDTHIKYTDEINNNIYDIQAYNAEANMKLIDANWDISLHSELLIKKFKTGKWEFFKEKNATLGGKLTYNEAQNLYTFNKNILTVQNARFSLDGKYIQSKNPYLELHFAEENGNIQTIMSFLPPNIAKGLEGYKSKGDIIFKGKVAGNIGRNTKPMLEVFFGCENAVFYHPDLDKKIENVSFKGYYHNGVKAPDKLSYITIDPINATFEGETVTGKFKLTDLANPHISASLKGSITLPVLKSVVKLNEYEKAEGRIQFDIEFEGDAQKIKQNDYTGVKANGYLKLNNIEISNAKSGIQLQKLNGEMQVQKSKIVIPQITFTSFDSDIEYSGELNNIYNYIMNASEALEIDGDIKSKMLNINNFMDTTTAKNNSNPIMFPKNINLNLTAKAGKLIYRHHILHNLSAGLVMYNNILTVNDLKTKYLGGNVALQLRAIGAKDSTCQIECSLDMDKIGIDSIFYKFADFNQSFITHNNIKGTLKCNIQSVVLINKYGEIVPRSITCEADMQLNKGVLKNFEPMMQLSKFVNEVSLREIKFSELKNKFLIAGKKIYIPEMQIKSSINTITLMGEHSFDNEYVYKLKIPVKNYKRLPSPDEAEATDDSERGEIYLYIIIKGKGNDMKVSYDKAAVKQKLKVRWNEEKKEFMDIFKKGYEQKKQELQKTRLLNDQKYLDLD